MAEVDKYGSNPDYARKCLEANRHNEATTVYYLLVKKYQRQGKKDVIDPNSSLTIHTTLNSSCIVGTSGKNQLAASVKLGQQDVSAPGEKQIPAYQTLASPYNHNAIIEDLSKESNKSEGCTKDSSLALQKLHSSGRQVVARENLGPGSEFVAYQKSASKSKPRNESAKKVPSSHSTPKAFAAREQSRLSSRAADTFAPNAKLMK